jgi:hypothetical protein
MGAWFSSGPLERLALNALEKLQMAVARGFALRELPDVMN